MEYYVIYKNEDLIAYCDNIYELTHFTGIPGKELRRKFKKSSDNSICCIINKMKCYVFSFNEVSE